MMQILIFGDSIAYGAWDKKGGWAGRLKEALTRRTIETKQGFYCMVHNLGISGDTTVDVLERLEFETRQRAKEKEGIVFIFSIGLNDSEFVHSKNGPSVPPEKFRKNLEKIIAICRKFSQDIIFLGLTPVDESKVDPIPWAAGKSYRNSHIQECNGIIRSVCAKEKVHFIEVFERWVCSGYKALLEDGAHPNSEGHLKIFELVKDFLTKSKTI